MGGYYAFDNQMYVSRLTWGGGGGGGGAFCFQLRERKNSAHTHAQESYAPMTMSPASELDS